MKRLYKIILLISLALFISCDEQKAKDDITKAIEKSENETQNVADNETPPPALIKPVPTSKRVAWNESIAFPKELGYSYALKEKKTGVAISKTAINAILVTATQSAQNVIIVATFDGRTIESDPIEFTRIQGNTLRFPHAVVRAIRSSGVTHRASNSGTVTGDDRTIQYSMSATGEGVTFNANSGRIEVGAYATYGSYTVTAELEENAKYTRSEARCTLTVIAH